MKAKNAVLYCQRAIRVPNRIVAVPIIPSPLFQKTVAVPIDLPAIRENPFVKHIGSPFLECFCFATKHIGKDEPFLFANSLVRQAHHLC
jgi:hypothetical protein